MRPGVSTIYLLPGSYTAEAAVQRDHFDGPWTYWFDRELQVTAGSTLIWPLDLTLTATVTPPASLPTQFVGMVQEVPRSFARSIQGRLPLIKAGWAIVRPQP